MIDGDGGDILYPIFEEGFIARGADFRIHAAAASEDKGVYEFVVIIGKVEAGGGGLGGVIIGEKIGAGAKFYFVEEDVVGAGADDADEKILAGRHDAFIDFEAKVLEL